MYIKLWLALEVLILTVGLAVSVDENYIYKFGLILAGGFVSIVVLLGLSVVFTPTYKIAGFVVGGILVCAAVFDLFHQEKTPQLLAEGTSLYMSLGDPMLYRDFGYDLIQKYQERYWIDCDLGARADLFEASVNVMSAVRLPPETEVANALLSNIDEQEVDRCKQLMSEMVSASPEYMKSMYKEIARYVS